MREIRRTGQFKRDVKRMQKRGKDMGVLRDIVVQIAAGETLDPRHRDHPLLGGYSGALSATSSPTGCSSTSVPTQSSS